MYDDQPQADTSTKASGGVPVYKRILDLFEAEGINTLFGIPDPNFVHMFLEAETPRLDRGLAAPRGCGRLHGRGRRAHHRQAGGVHRHARAGHRQHDARRSSAPRSRIDPIIFLGGQRARVTEQRVRRGRIQFVRQEPMIEDSVKYSRLDRICRPDRRDHPRGDPRRDGGHARARSTSNIPSHMILEEARRAADRCRRARYRLVNQGADGDRDRRGGRADPRRQEPDPAGRPRRPHLAAAARRSRSWRC